MPTSTAASPSSKPGSAEADLEELRTLKREKLRRLEARAESLLDYVPRVSPQYVRPEHLAPVAALFARINRGERVRACVSIPTQHGKTEFVLHGLTQILGCHPTWPLIYSTYQQEQSDDKSHRCRAIARSAGIELAADRQNLRMWRTAQGGGALFTSVDGPGSGQPAKVAVVDDPYKDLPHAMSPAVRKQARGHFTSVILQRGQEDMSVLLVHTRWVEMDLIGEAEAGEFGDGWEIINLPMLGHLDARGKLVPSPRPYTTATHVLNPRREMPDGRAFGWTLEGARKQLIELPEAEAEAMGQGNPRRSADGALWSWEHIIPWRVDEAPPLSKTVVFVDPNQSDDAKADKADDAGIITIARGADGRAYVLDDQSGHVGVDGWAARAVGSYRQHRAHSICAEADGGGELVKKNVLAFLLQEALKKSRETGRHVEPEVILVLLVRVAARGDKRGRSETARELYGDPKTARPSMVSHVGRGFPRLERNMTNHDYATSKVSRGDLDSLSLGLFELMLGRPAAAADGDVVRSGSSRSRSRHR